MGLTVKFTYEYIKDVIEKAGCKLISENYVNTKTKLKIQCKCGEVFETSYEKFIRKVNPKQQCNDCGKKLTADKNRISYDTVKTYIESKGCKLISTEYVDIQTPLKITCKTCGEIYAASFTVFKNKGKHECDDCVIKRISNMYLISYEEVKLRIENNSYGCKLISETYKGNDQLLDIECKCGNIFRTTLANFEYNNKHQCGDCGEIIRQNKLSEMAFSYEYVKKFIEENSECKLISTEYKNVEEKLLLECGCGEQFEVSFKNFKNRFQRKCHLCNKSRIELKIKEILESLSFNFIMQLRFDNCKNKKTLPFDFAIFDDNLELMCLIEADGHQHFKPVQFGGMSLERAKENLKVVQLNDTIKTNYCLQNNIPLIRISYQDFDDIEEILTIELNKLKFKEVS